MDFSKLAKPKGSVVASNVLELFEQLDRKATHNSLRPVQIEALKALDQQIAERDVLLKVSTGSGKTLVGLIYAEFIRRRYPGEASLYLCPTNQLVDQVTSSAAMIGIQAHCFSTDGLPHAALEGKAVLVCTYDRLFNARNTFARRNLIPSCIVMDDVHSGIDKARNKYTVRIPPSVYNKVREIFQPLCEATDPAIWRGISNNESHARYEVPYWIAVPQFQAVATLLEPLKEKDDIGWEWSNVARYVEYARLCISGTTAELSLPVAAVEENLAYISAKHRLFMSASIKDGSALLRDLALDPAALSRIIEPPSDRGAGERMILPAALIDPDLNKAAIAAICSDVSKHANVVVLTSSAKQAEVWQQSGAVLKKGDAVDEEIAELKATQRGRYVVFPQRFDGVDLPDDACRVLVIDGTPTGERLCDLIDAERQKNSPGYNSRAVNRFEQALGRAVRSSADYAAVILVGNDIASFIGRKDVKEALESHTREQIELGKDLADYLKRQTGHSTNAVRSAIDALISRESSWKEAHRDRMAGLARSSRPGSSLTILESAALAERQAWIEAKARNHQRAVAILQHPIGNTSLHSLQRAELMFRAAAYLHRVDPSRAASLYQAAFQLNSLLPRPLELVDKKYAKVRQQAVAMRDVLQNFTSVNAVLAALAEIRSRLSYSGDAETVEQSLKELGEMLGAVSSRPEKETGRGPDVLWLFDTIGLCIEAKNEKQRPIWKKDAEQLLLSKDWCETHTDLNGAIVPVLATNVTDADRPEDIAFGPKFMLEATIENMVARLRTLLTALSFDGPLFLDPQSIHQKLTDLKLRGEDLPALLSKAK